MLWPLQLGPVFNALLLTALLLPFIVYWAHNLLTRAALVKLLVAMGVMTLSVGAYQAVTLFPFTDIKKP